MIEQNQSGSTETLIGTRTNNNTPKLTSFINNFQNDIHKTLTENKTKFCNNLSTDERKALKDLSTDKSIIIKPADKGGAIVIMNAEDYEKVCLDHLADKTFYEQPWPTIVSGQFCSILGYKSVVTQ